MSEHGKTYTHAHPLTKWAQGLVLDFSDQLERGAFIELDTVLTRATEAAKDVEDERDKYRAALEEIASNNVFSKPHDEIAREALKGAA